MTDKFDIPEPMRDFAEKGLEQVRRAFETYLETAQGALESFGGQAAGARHDARALGEEAISFVEESVAANFEFARRIVNARDASEILDLQQAFIRRQMETLSRQGERMAALAARAGRIPNV